MCGWGLCTLFGARCNYESSLLFARRRMLFIVSRRGLRSETAKEFV